MAVCSDPDRLVTRKCCFCVRARRGLIIFGYINLVLSLLSLPLLVFMLAERATRRGAEGVKGGQEEGEEEAPEGLVLVLALCGAAGDAALTVLLLVGAHQRRARVLRWYVRLGGGWQAAALAADLVLLSLRRLLQSALYFLFLGVNVYVLYVAWSVSRRLRPRRAPAPAPAH